MRLFAEAYANRKSGMRNAVAGAWLCSLDVPQTEIAIRRCHMAAIFNVNPEFYTCAPSFLRTSPRYPKSRGRSGLRSVHPEARRERKGLGYYGTKRAAPAKRRPRPRRERRSSRKSRTRAVSGVFFRLTIFVKSTIRSSHYTRLLSDYNVTSRCRFRFIDRRALESIGAHGVTEEAN